MKVLVFHIGAERHGLPLTEVARVVPVAQLLRLTDAPNFFPGLLDLHGELVPVVDLTRLAGLTPESVRYDTRILLVDCPQAGGGTRKLGLQAERVAGVVEAGGIGDDAVRVTDLDTLLPPAARGMLFEYQVAA